MKTDMTFIEWKAEVQKALALRKWTRRDLADSLGYKYTYVCSITSGTQFSKKAVKAISDELGIESIAE